MKGFRKYFVVLIITVAIFVIAWYASIYFNNRKLANIKSTQDQVTVDVMSSETQFDLYEELSCKDIGNNYLSQEISDLADKLTYAEQNLNNPTQVELLKEQYSILEVKDFLLTQEISQRCKQPITTVLYFYKNEDSCADCTKQGYVLDALRQAYPQIRVYSFDAGLDNSTIRALLTIYNIPATLPSVVLNGKTISGFTSLDDLEAALPTYITAPTPAAPSTPVLQTTTPSK